MARLRLGMAVQVCEDFVRKEMDAVAPALRDLADTRLVSLVTDLSPPEELIGDGTMNVLLRKAVALGVKPARATALVQPQPGPILQIGPLGRGAPGLLGRLGAGGRPG